MMGLAQGQSRLAVRQNRAIEPLESRHMLALTIITPDEALAFPDWAYDMGTAIVAREGVYDQRDADQNGVADIVQNARINLTGTVEPVGAGQAAPDLVLYDWMIGSDTPNTADEMAGDLVDWITARLETVPMEEMHFIGHGRGALVNMEALRLLAEHPLADRIGFVQMTTLDPYARGDDGVIEFNPGGLVDFADNYYQDIDTEQLEHGAAILGALNFKLNDQLAAWNGRAGELADHHEVHDWYHWTIASGTTAADSPVLADADLPVPSSEDRAQLYDGYVADLDGNDTPDDFGGGAYLGYYFTVPGGGIGNVGGDGALTTIDVARRVSPLYLGLVINIEVLEIFQGLGYAPNGDLHVIINASPSSQDPAGLYRIQLQFDANNQPVPQRTFVNPVPEADPFEYAFDFESDGSIIAGAPGANLQTQQQWDLLQIDPATGEGQPAYHVSRLPFNHPIALAIDHAGNVYFTTTFTGTTFDVVRVSSDFSSDVTLNPPPANVPMEALSVIDGLLYGTDVNGDLYSLNLVTGQFLERGELQGPFGPSSVDNLTSVHSLRQPRWHNRAMANDVDGNGRVNTSDSLVIINTLLASGPRSIDPAALFSFHYDTTNDGRVNTSDLLSVFNQILRDAANEESQAEATLANPLVADSPAPEPAAQSQGQYNWIAFAAALGGADVEGDEDDEAGIW